jgi:hypothetical protein
MSRQYLGLVFALLVCTPAAASVSALHDPARQSPVPASSVSSVAIVGMVSDNEEPGLPLECRGYNVPGKSRRPAPGALNRCE